MSRFRGRVGPFTIIEFSSAINFFFSLETVMMAPELLAGRGELTAESTKSGISRSGNLTITRQHET